MRWRMVLAGGAVLLMLVLQLRQPGAAYACLCQSPGLEAEFDSSDAVFLGEVIDIQPAGEHEQNVIFKVSKGWKGSYQTMVVRRSLQGGGCNNYAFDKGEEYIVFASSGWYGNSSTVLYVSTCGFTDLVSAEMLAELRLISREQPTLAAGPPPGAGGLPWGWLALAAGLAAAGIWRWRRASRPI
jgi:hypothetical protein